MRPQSPRVPFHRPNRFLSAIVAYALLLQTATPVAFARESANALTPLPLAHARLATAAAAASEIVLHPLMTPFNGHGAIAHQPAMNAVLVSAYEPSGQPQNLELIAADGTHRKFSNLAGVTGELVLATARDAGHGTSLGGFRPGEVFLSTSAPGAIARIAPDGATLQNPWVTLPNTAGPVMGLTIDTSGAFGGDVLASTAEGAVWRIAATGAMSRIAVTAVPLGALVTIANDAARYGAWAGRILVAAKAQPLMYAIDPQGVIASVATPFVVQDLAVVAPHENFFGSDPESRRLMGAPADAFTSMIGDLVAAQKSPGVLSRVRWNGTDFEWSQIAQTTRWSHVTFSPAGVGEIAPARRYYDRLAVVRHAPSLDSGRVDGALWQLAAENVELDGTDAITTDLLVPGTPAVTAAASATFGGVVEAGGNRQPTTCAVTIGGKATLGHLITRSDPVELAPVAAPPVTTGTRDVSVQTASDIVDFATLRNLSISGKAGVLSVPPGNYGAFTATGRTVVQLGIANSAQAAIYNLDALTLGGGSELRLAGPVVLNVRGNVEMVGSTAGNAALPSQLGLNIAAGSLRLSGSAVLYAIARAPQSSVTIEGNGRLRGTVSCDRLAVTGNGVLQITDNGAPAPPINRPPAVDAGADQTITLPVASVPLSAVVSDDGLPAGVPLAIRWAASGPAPVDFSDVASAAPTARFTLPGTYVLRLTASDSLLSMSDTVTVTVMAQNQAPAVDAGADQTITFPSAATLSGSATDDGLPAGGVLDYRWSRVSGPGEVTFANASAQTTTATFSTPGAYTLRLAVSDRALTTSDDVVVTVLAANKPPVVNAGADQTITLPNVATVNGGATDDGLPQGSTLQYQWSGPAQVTFSSPTTATTTAAFAQAGVYTLRLTVSDGALSASDDVVVTVMAANKPPIVNAGVDIAAVHDGDLLTNGSAEIAARSDGSLPGWRFAPSTPWKRVVTGTAAYPAGAEGNAFFAYTGSAPSGELSQDVDVSAFALAIDGGAQHFELTASVRSAAESLTDSARVVVEYLPSSTAAPLATFDSGPIASTEGWTRIGDDRVAPAGTRLVRVRLLATRNSGATADAYFDGVSLRAVGVAAATLHGSALDDSGPLTTRWSQVSGPAEAAFSSASSLTTAVVFLLPGTYALRLTASDPELSTSDDVVVTVIASDHPPRVDAGDAVTVELPATGTLHANVRDDDSASLTTNWTYLSGPATPTIADPSQLATTVTFPLAGVYVFRISASDATTTTYDEVTVTVAAWNHPPAINAGSDQSVRLPAKATLAVTVSDDGLPAGSSTSVTWTQVSGPAAADIADPNATSSAVTFHDAGTYVFRATASDTALQASDDVAITVLPANLAPRVSAGANQTITLPATTTLNGTAADDGVPSALIVAWSAVSGPAAVTFSAPTAATTSAAFAAAGTYVLRLIANDGELSASADVTVIVLPAPVNQAPAVDAGADQTIDFGSPATLHGTLIDDGLPAGAAITSTWTAVTGPGVVTFSAPAQPQTTATFSAAGTYVLRLTASDTALTASDEMTVIARRLPIASFTVPGPSRNVARVWNNVASVWLGASIVSVTSDLGGSFAVGTALDDNPNSGWRTNYGQNQNQSFVVRLFGDVPRRFDRIRLLNGVSGLGVSRFRVDASTTTADDAAFTTVLRGVAAEVDRMQDYALPAPIAARFLRFTAIDNHGASQLWIRSFDAIDSGRSGVPSYETDGNLAAPASGGAVVGASNNGAGATIPLLDGNPATFWRCDGTTDQWVLLELPQTALIDRIRLTGSGDARSVQHFRVGVATADAISFTTVLEATAAADNAPHEFVFPGGAVATHYVRIDLLDNQGDPWSTSISDVAVLVARANVSVSDYNGGAGSPEAMLDSLPGTYWSFTPTAQPAFAVIRLSSDGDPLIDAVGVLGYLDGRTSVLRDFDVLVSDTTDEPAAFRTVLSATYVNNAQYQRFSLPGGAVRARYVKLVVKSNYGETDETRVGMFEVLTAKGDGNIISGPLPPPSIGSNVAAVSSTRADGAAANAFDGNAATMWLTASGALTDQWIKVAFPNGATRRVYGVGIDPNGYSGPREFEIRVSTTTTDDAAFTTVYSGVAAQGGMSYFFNRAVDAKYVEFYWKNGYGSATITAGELPIYTVPDDGAVLIEASSSGPQFDRSALLDNNLQNDGWITADGAVADQHVTVALPAAHPWLIDGVALQSAWCCSAQSPHEFLVQVADHSDGPFTTVLDAILAPTTILEHYAFAPVETQYVRLVVKDNYGGTSIVLNAFQVFSPQAGTLQARFIDTSAPGEGALHYAWDFGDGTAGTDRDPLHAFGNPGTYPVALTVTDDAGHTSRRVIPYTATGTPAADFTVTPSPASEGELVTFTDTSSIAFGDIVRSDWSFGDGQPDALSRTTQGHIYDDNGVYTVTHRVMNTRGAVSTVTRPIVIANVAPAADAGPDQTLRWGDNWPMGSTLFAEPSAADRASLRCAWSFGDGTTAEKDCGSPPPHSFSAPGVYTVTLTVTDKDGASGTDRAQYTAIRRLSSLVYGGARAATANQPLHLRATLRDADFGTPLPGRQITFVVEGATITATTDANGEAAADPIYGGAPASPKVTVSFAGDDRFEAATGSVVLTCQEEHPIDAVLLADMSDSMYHGVPDLRVASRMFLDSLLTGRDQAAVLMFQSRITTLAPLSHDLDAARAAVGGFFTCCATNLGGGVDVASGILNGPAHTPGATKVLVIVSDGEADVQPSLDAAAAARATGIRIISVMIGASPDGLPVMKGIASSPGDFYQVNLWSELRNLYASLGATLCHDGTASARRVASLIYGGGRVAAAGQPLHLRATLRDADGGTPISGRPVTFLVEGTSVVTTTDAHGEAAAEVVYTAAAASPAVTLSFGGDDQFQPVTSSVTLSCSSESPIDAVLLADMSSVPASAVPDVRAASRMFVDSLVPQRDQAGVVMVQDQASVLAPLSHDLDAARGAMAAFSSCCASNLPAGIAAGAGQLNGPAHTPGATKVMVVVSDGVVDAESSLAAAAAARDAGIRIISVVVGSAFDAIAVMKGIASSPADFYQTDSWSGVRGVYASLGATLCQAFNHPPTVSAGAAQRVVAPQTTVTLTGTATDDGLPAGASFTLRWTKVSGPGNVTFASATALETTATFDAIGDYVLRLTASDTQFTRSSDVKISVEPLNRPPAVDAGPNQVISVAGQPATLAATATDDGYPALATLTYAWTQISGPAAATLSTPDRATTSVSFAARGTYTFRVTVSDSLLSASDDVTITYSPANGAPVVNAGADQTIVDPVLSTTLSGSATDDGEPAGATLRYFWTQRSGPAATIAAPAQASTAVTFPTHGVYQFRLTVSDSQLTATDDVQVTVDGTNAAPVVNAGVDRQAAIDTSIALAASVTDDALPTDGSLSVTWVRVSGPGTVSFADASRADTTATFGALGTYVLRLTATDGALSASDEVAFEVVSAGTKPVVSITAPADGGETTTLTSVIGSVSANANASWRLESRLVGSDGDWTTISTGNSAVAASSLGTLDPTLLVNGLYELRLSATDALGQTSAATVRTAVTGEHKVGNFTISFVDLALSYTGLPIQVTRTYDSRVKEKRDFGAGWSLSVSNARLQETRAPGSAWKGTVTQGGNGFLVPTYCFEPTEPHIVTVTLSDSRVYEFEAVVSAAGNCRTFAPAQEVTLEFRPRPGTHGSLTPVGGGALVVDGSWPGPLELLDADGPADYNQYLLTVEDGTVMRIDRERGVLQMTTANGATVTFSHDGILHSDGSGIAFIRDAQDRITAIKDPSGAVMTYAYDGRGDLVAYNDREQHLTTFTYAPSHYLAQIIDPRGVQAVRNEYDDSGRMIRQIDANGKAVTFSYDLGTRVEVVTDRNGKASVYEYDDRGNLVKLTDSEGRVLRKTYDARGHLLSETNPAGKTITYTWDDDDNRVGVVDPMGRTSQATFGPLHRPTMIRDENGHVWARTYDARGNLLSATDPNGSTATNTYDASGRVFTQTDRLGRTTRFDYDQAGNVARETRPDGSVVSYTTDANRNTTSISTVRTMADGTKKSFVESYEYDKLGHRIKTIDADGRVTLTEYNAIGKKSATVDPLGRRTTFAYDDLGHLSGVTYPDGTAEAFRYDAEGRLLTKVDRNGHTTTTEYDGVGRATRITSADGTSTSRTYDVVGNVTSETDAAGLITRLTYDDSGRRTQTADALGRATSFTYDGRGNVTSVSNGAGQVTRYEYDVEDRLLRTTYPDGTATSTTYDEEGQQLTATDAEGHVTRREYDARGHVTKVIDALNHATSYRYDESGNIVAQTDANGRITTFEYDGAGHRTRRTLPGGASETYVSAATGNVVSRTDFNGRTTRFTYDAANRLIRRIADPSFHEPDVVYTYEPAGARKSMSDASGTTTYTRDLRGRLTSKVTPYGTLTYSYGANGLLSGVRSSNENGTDVTYSYDALNRMQNVTSAAGEGATYTYDELDRIAAIRTANGVVTSATFDALGRPLKVEAHDPNAATLSSFVYTRGAAGEILTVSESTGHAATYNYDGLFHLARESIDDPDPARRGVLDYTYDAVGNRTRRDSTLPLLGSTAQTFDADDRLGTDTYDANGNTLSSFTSAPSYKYDSENRLVDARNGIARCVYDGDGNRVAMTVNGVTTNFLVDTLNPTGQPQVLEELSGGAVQRVYTYGYSRIAQRIHRASGWTTSYYGYDAGGSVRFLTDTAAGVTDTYQYDAFGNLLSITGTTDNAYLYRGERYDAATGFYYLRARYYIPTTGRFLTMDSFEGDFAEPSTLHKYLYAGNDPVNGVDPSGHQTFSELMATLDDYSVMVSIQLPKYAGVMQFIIEAATPLEIQAAYPTGMTILATAGVTGAALKGVAEETGMVVRAGEMAGEALPLFTRAAKRAEAMGRLVHGQNFERFVQEVLGIQDIGRKVKNGIEVGWRMKGSAVLDGMWEGMIVEIKTSFGAVKLHQLEELALYGQRVGAPILYVFEHPPTQEEISFMRRFVAQVTEGEVGLSINWLNP